MYQPAGLTAILDANVLYPAPLRDFLLSLAEIEMYKPRWTDTIQDEWIRNLLANRRDLKQQDLERTRMAMDNAFPEASITGYERLIDRIILPDQDDRHVVAAAVEANADLIITFNLKDFPRKYLKLHDIEVQHPDNFIANLISTDKIIVLEALINQARRLRNPAKSIKEVLQTLENCGLIKSTAALRI